MLGFTSRIINPDRLIDKFTGKEGLFENSPFDERTRQLISKTKMPLGILIDKGLKDVNEVFIPIFNANDAFLVDYAQRLIYNNDARVSILDVKQIVSANFVLQSAITSLEKKYPDNLIVDSKVPIDADFLSKQDLMIISLESWKMLVHDESAWLKKVPTVLIVKP